MTTVSLPKAGKQDVAKRLPWISTFMLDLRQCLCDALAERGAGPPCWCGIFPGQQVAWDFCGECHTGACGMGYLQLARVFPSTQFPSQDVLARCRSPLAYQINVGSLRCLPVADQDGSLPDEGAILDAALAVNLDMAAAHYAIECCIDKTSEHMVGQYEPLGPMGGCVGGQWMLTVAP